MRTIDRPYAITIIDGLVRFECAGIVSMLEPTAAAVAGRRLLARAGMDADPSSRRGQPDKIRARIGKLLVDAAGDALRKRTARREKAISAAA